MRLVFVLVCLLSSAVLGSAQNNTGEKPPASHSKKPPKSSLYDDNRPRMAGSSTGYVDNPIIGTQVRFRFDGDFDLRNPDRAEFFYAKCGCYGNGAPGPGRFPAVSANLQEIQLNVEYAITSRFSILAETPGRWIQFPKQPAGQPISSASGIGDFRAGFKVGLIATDKRALTFQFRTYFPTGDSHLGLGTNHYSIEPTILYHQRMTRRLALSGEFGDWHPIGGSSGLPTGVPPVVSGGFASDVIQYGVGAGYDVLVRENYRVTPVIEFVGWHVLSGFVTGAVNPSSSGVNIVNAKFGTRISFHKHHSIYAGYGRELTNASWYTNMLRMEYRFVL